MRKRENGPLKRCANAIPELLYPEANALKSTRHSGSSGSSRSQGRLLEFRTINQHRNVALKPLNQSWDRFAVYWETT